MGIKLTFGDFIKVDEMKQWVEESKKALLKAPLSFGVLIDMRTLKPLSADVQKVMEEGQRLYKTKGMKRSVVVLESSTIAMQFKRIAKDSGIYQWERYISAQDNPNWERTGIAWIKDGVDPDK